MKTLIINADDMGLSDAVNEAIIGCYKAEVISGVSLMACGRRFKEASRMLRDVGATEIGAHLTLTGRFRPSSKDASQIKTLLDNAGTFLPGYAPFAVRYLRSRISKSEIREELSAQIEAILSEGLKITHLDSHEHVHMFPAVLDAIVSLAAQFGIKYIRLPLESPRMLLKDPYFKDIIRYSALRPLAARARGIIKGAGLSSNEFFLGHVHSGRLNEEILSYMALNVKEGVTELVAHPAVLSRVLLEESPWHVNGAKEMKSLMGDTWKSLLAASGITVLPHSKLAA